LFVGMVTAGVISLPFFSVGFGAIAAPFVVLIFLLPVFIELALLF